MSALGDHKVYLATILAKQASRRTAVDPTHAYAPQPDLGYGLPTPQATPSPEAGPSASSSAAATGKGDRSGKGKSKANVVNYVPAEEAVRNDYAAWYGVSGAYPSNWVLGAGDNEICDEFPALRRLMDLKAEQVASVAHPPLYAHLPSTNPGAVQATLAPHRFDVILIHQRGPWSEISALPIRQLSADPGFVFLWVGRGNAEGLEAGRQCLAKWGFRRAEDIVWVKTNKHTPTGGGSGGATSLFASQKEHCLMGIRGTVRRSTDHRFVHCNVDTDVIVWEGDDSGPATPPYLYTLIENFCLGARRLELFGDGTRARPGWVTASLAPAPPNPETLQFDPQVYPALLPQKDEGKPVVPFHAEIDQLRPKSPQRRQRGGGGGGGGGYGRGSTPASPPRTHPNSPFRPQGFSPGPGQQGVMRMGALTPAGHMGMAQHGGYGGAPNQPMGNMNLSMQQQQQLQFAQMAQMAQMQAQMQAAQQMGGMQGMQGMHMGQMLPHQMAQAQMMGGMNQVQMAQMGMMPMSHMGMMPGMMPMMPGMMPGMGMAMGGGMGGMDGSGMGYAMDGSPTSGGGELPAQDGGWSPQASMGQLAVDMGAMGMGMGQGMQGQGMMGQGMYYGPRYG